MQRATGRREMTLRIVKRCWSTTTSTASTIPRSAAFAPPANAHHPTHHTTIFAQKRSLAIIHGPPTTSASNQLFEEEDDDEDSFRQHAADYNNHDDEQHYPLHGPNPGLASIIAQGSKSLEQSAADIEYKTRNISLSQPHKKGSLRAGTLEPRQLAEGQRILDTATDCLETIILQQAERGGLTEGQRKGIVLGGEPIVLLECVVNSNVKQAKLYWTLPYGILMDERIHYQHQRLYQQLIAKVQQQLVEGGGAKLLAGCVHAKLSSYYPPRIKMLPATDEMVIKAIEEYNL
ncbi:MAG: hypothetical protein SGILL_007056 [Bacillariaceae sp.]